VKDLALVEVSESQKEAWRKELEKKYPPDYLYELDLRSEETRVGGKKAAAEDYALRRIPATWRWNWPSVMWVVWGGVTYLYGYYLGGLLSTGFGMEAFLVSAVVSLIWMIYPTLWFSYKSSREGVSADLLSRGSMGYGGSAFSTIIYVFLWIYYFAAEGEIMSYALNSYVPQIPLWGWEIVVAAIFIPLTLYGMTFLSKFQLVTWFIWLPLIVAMNYLAFFGHNPNFISMPFNKMLTYQPPGTSLNFVDVMLATGSGFGLFVLWPLWAMDYGRFLKLKEMKRGTIWYWLPYTFVPWLNYVLGGFIAILTKGPQPNPGVYSVWLLGAGGVVLSVVTQLRINVENVYSGSLSYANFFSRAVHWVPGRRFWTYVFIFTAWLAMEFNILGQAGPISTFFTIWLGSWITVMFVDYTVTRKILKVPQYTEFKRAYLANFNVPNVLAMWIPIIINLPPYLQISGIIPKTPSLGPAWYESSAWLFAIIEAAILAVILPRLWPSNKINRQYLVRPIDRIPESLLVNEEFVCPVCHQRNYKADYAYCPWYENGIYICSYCCMGTNCHSACHKSLTPLHNPIPAKPPHGFIDSELAAEKITENPKSATRSTEPSSTAYQAGLSLTDSSTENK
jgi:cytosine permease